MLFRSPITLETFRDLAFQEVNFTLKLKGESYILPMASVHTFDYSKLTAIACSEKAPADILLLPAYGNVTFKTMAALAPKKTLRLLVPRLDPSDFLLNLDNNEK